MEDCVNFNGKTALQQSPKHLRTDGDVTLQIKKNLKKFGGYPEIPDKSEKTWLTLFLNPKSSLYQQHTPYQQWVHKLNQALRV